MVKFKFYAVLLVWVGCHGCPQIVDKIFHISNVYNVADLLKQIDCINNGVPLKKLLISNIRIDTLPRGLFNNTNIETIIIKNSSIKSLAPNDGGGVSPFFGLEDHLKRFIVIKPDKHKFKWKWLELSKLKKLEKISIGNEALSEGAMKEFVALSLNSLKWIQLTGGCMPHLPNRLFSNFPNLERISLQGNELTVVRRNCFPNPANKLKHLDISFNKLFEIGVTLFDEMPVIEEINLSNNQITTFHTLTDLPRLRKFYIYGNSLKCDITIAWLILLNITDEEGVPFYEDKTRPLHCRRRDNQNLYEVKKLTINDLQPLYTNIKQKRMAKNYIPLRKCYSTSAQVSNVASAWHTSKLLF